MWTKYEVEMNFLTKLVGSVPADPELVKRWLESRQPRSRPPDSKSIDEIAEEVMGTMDAEPADPALLVFQRLEGGPVVRMGTIRAHLKDCARVLSRLYVGKLEKEASFAVKVLSAVYYPPAVYWLPILSQIDDKQVREASGTKEKPVHFMTPQGQRSSIKQFEYVENARLRVPLKVLSAKKVLPGKLTGKPVVSEEDLNSLFEYGGTHGYGGERSDGEGRYIATIKEVE